MNGDSVASSSVVEPFNAPQIHHAERVTLRSDSSTSSSSSSSDAEEETERPPQQQSVSLRSSLFLFFST